MRARIPISRSFKVLALMTTVVCSSLDKIPEANGQSRKDQQLITATVLTPRLTGRCQYGDSASVTKESVRNAIRRSLPTLGFQERLSVSGLDSQTLGELERERKRQGSANELGRLDYAILASAVITCKTERYREPFSNSTVTRHIDQVTVQSDLVRISDELLIAQGNGSATNSQSNVSNRYAKRGTFSFNQILLSNAVGNAMSQLKRRLDDSK